MTDVTRKDSLDLGANVDFRAVNLVIQVVFNDLWNWMKKATSLAVLDPLESRMGDPQNVDPARLARGVPLRMACVSLESGRLRCVTGDGHRVEADGVTPVASALPDGDAPQEQQADYTTAVSRVGELSRDITRQADEGDPHRRLTRADAERAEPVRAHVD